LRSASTAPFARLPRPETVWTIGRIELNPGSLSIVPGKADLMLQFRDADPGKSSKRMEAALTDLVAANRPSGFPFGSRSRSGLAR